MDSCLRRNDGRRGVGGVSGGATAGATGAAEDLDAGGAFEPVVEEFGGAGSFEVGDDAGVEGDGGAGAYARAPLSFPEPDVVSELGAGLGVLDVDQQDAAVAFVAPSQYGGEAGADA